MTAFSRLAKSKRKPAFTRPNRRPYHDQQNFTQAALRAYEGRCMDGRIIVWKDPNVEGVSEGLVVRQQDWRCV